MSRRGKGETCAYCKRRLETAKARCRLAATKDHVLPQSRGGTGYLARTVWCCRQCNTLKASMMPEEWSKFMAQNPFWWTRPEFKVPRFTRRVKSVETINA